MYVIKVITDDKVFLMGDGSHRPYTLFAEAVGLISHYVEFSKVKEIAAVPYVGDGRDIDADISSQNTNTIDLMFGRPKQRYAIRVTVADGSAWYYGDWDGAPFRSMAEADDRLFSYVSTVPIQEIAIVPYNDHGRKDLRRDIQE